MITLDSKETWWTEYGAIQGDIKNYIQDMPVRELLGHPLAKSILTVGATEAYEEHQDKTIFQVWDILRDNKDARLWDILNTVWADAPDSPIIHSWPSWGRFCDLCSEGSWLFKDELAQREKDRVRISSETSSDS